MFIRGMYGLRPHPPQIGGFEACGTVESCGEGVEMPAGSKVIFTQTGVWAEYVCVAANTVILNHQPYLIKSLVKLLSTL